MIIAFIVTALIFLFVVGVQQYIINRISGDEDD
mgnify:CR=1 FL=1